MAVEKTRQRSDSDGVCQAGTTAAGLSRTRGLRELQGIGGSCSQGYYHPGMWGGKREETGGLANNFGMERGKETCKGDSRCSQGSGWRTQSTWHPGKERGVLEAQECAQCPTCCQTKLDQLQDIIHEICEQTAISNQDVCGSAAVVGSCQIAVG